MEKSKGGIIAVILVIVTVAAIILAVILRNLMNKNDGEAMDVSLYADRGITEAYMIADEKGNLAAYDVYVTVDGYRGPIETKVKIDRTGKTLMELQIISQEETPELGGKITESSFLSQFSNKALPIQLVGDAKQEGKKTSSTSGDNRRTGNASTKEQAGNTETTGDESAVNGSLGEGKQRMDGVYQAEKQSGDYTDQVTMIISGGEITEVHWDSFDKDGNGKRALSLSGKYIMREDGLLWADQADALQNYVIEHQGLNNLATNQEGKTDTISGVSISITDFKNLVTQCLYQATEGDVSSTDTITEAPNVSDQNPENQDQNQGNASVVDGISGATVSSRAVVTAIQTAYEFVMQQDKSSQK